MKQRWLQWNTRFSRLQQRERGLIVVGGIGAMLLLGYMLVVQPRLAQRARLQQQVIQQQTDARVLQEQIQALNQKHQDPDALTRMQLSDARKQLGAVNDQFKQLEQALVTPQEMAHVLEDLLHHNSRLQLKSLRTLPMMSINDMLATKVEKDVEKTDKTAVVAGKESHEAWLYRHGVEITVQGSYAGMLAYLSELEHLPRRVYWGELKLNAEAYPVAVLTVTLYTLSLDKLWLMV
jgi:MSHA biogenesis protein MshJ